MALPLPSHDPNSYDRMQAGTDGNHACQQEEELGFLADASSSCAYPTSGSMTLSNPASSNAVQPSIIALFGIHESTRTFSEAHGTFLPLVNPPFTQNDLFGNQVVSSNSIVFPTVPDISFPTAWETGGIFSMALDSNGYFPMEFDNLLPTLGVDDQIPPLTDVQAGLTDLRNFGNYGVWNQGLLAAPNEKFPLSYPGPLAVPLKNDPMSAEGTINSLSQQRHSVEHNTVSFAATMPQEFSNMNSTDASVASSDVGSLLQGRLNWDRGLSEHMTNLPSLPPFKTQCLESPSKSYNVVSAEKDAISHDAAVNSLTYVLGGTHGLRRIEAKDGTPPRDKSINIGRKSVTKGQRSRGRRTHLDAKTRKDAAFMRIKHACAPCFVNNIKCSRHDTCTRCLTLPKTPFLGTLCHRNRLQDYSEVFLPSFLIEHLREDAIAQFNADLQFTNNETEVQLSTGATHPYITLLVSKIIPPDEEFLMVTDLTSETNDHRRTFATVQSLQYAMRNYSIEQVKQKCKDHIEAISKAKYLIGDHSTLRYKLLQAISRFAESIPVTERSNLLRNAIMMNRIHYVMGRQILVDGGSALNDGSSLAHKSESRRLASRPARPLTRQIKGVMTLLLEELTKKVLQQADWQLRKRNREYATICLCTFLVLCMSAEELQVALDAFTLFKASRNLPSGGGDPRPIFQSGTEACGKLEKVGVEVYWILLSGILNRILKSQSPFRLGSEMECEQGQTEAKEILMREIRGLLVDHCDEISTQSADHYYGGGSRLIGDHKIFRRKNFGRLISIALGELR